MEFLKIMHPLHCLSTWRRSVKKTNILIKSVWMQMIQCSLVY